MESHRYVANVVCYGCLMVGLLATSASVAPTMVRFRTLIVK